jgi:putative Mn2+ efflux pump MntP
MSLLEILTVALGLAMDAFAVCVAAGAAGFVTGPRPVFRLSFHFGLFQFFMPVIGWLAGTGFVGLVGELSHWLAFGLLVLVGARMIRSGVAPPGTVRRRDPSRGATLVLLSAATSIDALAVGLSLALLRMDIWYPSAIIGVVAAGMSLLGLALGVRLGRQLGARLGQRLEIGGGILLCLLGAKVLLESLLA